LRPNEEVSEPIPLPVSRLLEPDRFSTTYRTLDGDVVPVYTYELDQRVIWGATARILKGLLDLIRGDPALSEALRHERAHTQ
jgi:hypothetical protein